jgi:hypothetical protein
VADRGPAVFPAVGPRTATNHSKAHIGVRCPVVAVGGRSRIGFVPAIQAPLGDVPVHIV